MRIEPSTLDFLNDLRRNNYREWFHANKPRYEAAKANVLDVAAVLIEGINRFDPWLGYPDPRKSLFRIARDIRFSANKEPYKTHFGIALSPIGAVRREPMPCYYLHVDPGEFFVSCGIYMTDPEVLRRVRGAIVEDWGAFEKIVSDKAFRAEFGDLSREEKVLKRVPAGFDKDSPAAEYLKLTNYYVFKNLSPSLLTDEKTLCEALRLFRLMQPLRVFLSEAVAR